MRSTETNTGKIALVISVLALGVAISWTWGASSPPLALVWLSLAITAAGWSVLGPTLPDLDESHVVLALEAALAVQFLQSLALANTYWYWRPGLALCAALGIAALSKNVRISRVAFPAMLATFFFIGALTIVKEPQPNIDVYMLHQHGAAALLHGRNPYTVRYPDIYAGKSEYYGPGIAVGGWLTTGYPYPPPTLVASTLGFALAGDSRFAFLAAFTAAAALLRYSRPNRQALLASLLLLATPFAWHLIRHAWTEPLLILLLAAMVYAESRNPKWSPWLLGVLLVSKQYVIFIAPLALLRWRRAALTRAAIAGSLAVLPFALLDVTAFWRSVVTHHLVSPLRSDGLAYSANLAGHGIALPSWLPFVAAAGATAWVLWKAPSTAQGFFGGCAFVTMIFFSLSKQAFLNYWFFPIGALCCAIASREVRNDVAQ